MWLGTPSAFASAFRDVYSHVYTCSSIGYPTSMCGSNIIAIPGTPDAIANPYGLSDLNEIEAARDIIIDTTHDPLGIVYITQQNFTLDAGRNITLNTGLGKVTQSQVNATIVANAQGSISGTVGADNHVSSNDHWTFVEKGPGQHSLHTDTPRNVTVCDAGTLGCYVGLATVQRALAATIQLVRGAKGIVKKFAQSGMDKRTFLYEIGTDIEVGLGDVIGKIGGLVSQIGLALLNTDDLQGSGVIYNAINDKNPDTHGLYTTPAGRRALQKVMRGISNQGHPLQPSGKLGNAYDFKSNVLKGQPLNVDPVVNAGGFKYVVDSGPLFAGFALPYLGLKQQTYEVQYFSAGTWVDFGSVLPLTVYNFASPVKEFRVTGVLPEDGAASGGSIPWNSMLLFSDSGYVAGSISPIATATPPNNLPEPGSFYLLGTALSVLGICLLFGKKAKAV